MVVFREVVHSCGQDVVHRLCARLWYIDCVQGCGTWLCSGKWYIDCVQGCGT
jgi:hypothetical protein